MEENFIFKIIDLFFINEEYIVTGELANDIEINTNIIVKSDDKTVYGKIERIEVFENNIPVSINSAVRGQPVGLVLTVADRAPLKKGMCIYKMNLKNSMKDLRLNGFLGVEFGSSKETAKEILLSRKGCVLDEVNSSDTALFFDDMKFAGRETSNVMLLFVDDKFAKAAVYIKPKLDAYVLEVYREIKNELNSKYFVTDDDFENYQQPYEENDGYLETGISLGKISISSFWSFVDANNGLEDFIALKISEDLEIVIHYEDGDLADEMVNKNNDANSLDY